MNYPEILRQMSLEEKIALCSGKDLWHTKGFAHHGIPSIMMADGPHGLRKQVSSTDNLSLNDSVPATCFPTAVATGCSWDPELLCEIGAAIAREAGANGVGLVLGPGVNMKRNPLCGRNFEYFSEDPYLAGKLAAGFIRGAQNEGIGTSLKHFAFNNQEYRRLASDSIMDARTMREIYLPAFETAVKEGRPATVMCAYNKINGTYCSNSKELLTEILRHEWGYDGLVVTDWGAMADRIQAFRAGCDLNMPGGSAFGEKEVLQAVRSGALSEAEVDACADRVLTLVFGAARAWAGTYTYDADAHHALACKAAEQSAVLLKNEGAILPLAPGARVAFIGHMARQIRYQGAGSSHINPTRLENVTDVMPAVPFAAGFTADGETTAELLAEAAALASGAEAAVVFAGLTDRYESEGFDREHMRMPEGHNRLIEAVAAANPNTVVVLMCGSAVEVPWLDQVKAILYMGLPGQAGGRAITNLLYGKANPGGKLAESWPVRYEDCVSAAYYANGKKDAEYRESVYVGYRYYDKAEVAVRYPFGHGLSYTQFAFSDLAVSGDTVTATVTNVGKVAGSEVAQLYVGAPQDGIHRPVRELKGFQKVFLQPGESRQVSFALSDRSFAVWADGWRVPGGTYLVMVGPSSRELPLCAEVQVAGEAVAAPAWQQGSWYGAPKGAPTRQQWEMLLGRTVVEPVATKGSFTLDNTLGEMRQESWVLQAMFKLYERIVARKFGGKAAYASPEFKMMMVFAEEATARSMQILMGRPGYFAAGLVDLANGRYLRGVRRLLTK